MPGHQAARAGHAPPSWPVFRDWWRGRFHDAWSPDLNRYSETLVLCASGPSLTADDRLLVAAARGAGRCACAAVNNTALAMPWCDIAYACDGPWWRHHGAEWMMGAGLTQDQAAAKQFGLVFVPGQSLAGLCADADMIHLGGNSGFQLLNIAAHLWPRRIILLGYDFMAGPAGELHHHADHPRPLHNPDAPQMAAWVRAFDGAAEFLAERGIDIVNCSRRTALTQFPRGRLEDCL